MKNLVFLLFFAFSLFFFPPKVSAIYDPLSVPNNKFGIHIIDENDLENAAKLVNSSGGDWGYVTLVITEHDRKLEKWEKIFKKFADLHLIPLLRLATTLQDNIWLAPQKKEAENWAIFLDQLPWPIENRYVILFNEPNHAKEWGGRLSPEEYAKILITYSTELKKTSPDFFVLPAGFDASAPNSLTTMDEEYFLKKMVEFEPSVFQFIDGWTSHSYPNPGFRGNPEDIGRGTLQTFLWEKALLEKLGITKFFPIFITETGWSHNHDQLKNSFYDTPQEVARKIRSALENVWQEKDIVAITPFILNYQSFPFFSFSWQKPGSSEFYPQYYTYQSFPKIQGLPRQKKSVIDIFLEKGKITKEREVSSAKILPIFCFSSLLQFISQII